MASGRYTTAIVARPVGDVWALITDFGRAAEWMPGVSEVDEVDAAPLGSGKRFTATLATTDARHQWPMEIVDWDPEFHIFSLRTTLGSRTVLHQISVEDEGGGRTAILLRGRFEGGGFFFRLLSPMIRSALMQHERRMADGMKALVEREPGPGGGG